MQTDDLRVDKELLGLSLSCHGFQNEPGQWAASHYTGGRNNLCLAEVFPSSLNSLILMMSLKKHERARELDIEEALFLLLACVELLKIKSWDACQVFLLLWLQIMMEVWGLANDLIPLGDPENVENYDPPWIDYNSSFASQPISLYS